MKWDEALQGYTYECPCGDVFAISGDELAAGEDFAHCASCSLLLRVRCNVDAFAEEWARRAQPPPPQPPAATPPPPAPVEVA